ncbi:DUF599 domain-containing protein [Phenylobacterium soli]|uniref:DUF599 domain-containing protein n=1 Tax=Phenylobacterium soli TaxID=2170551 RepID=A0A328ANT5_9CAUL|nr:DUF599 domain-containing protein [Phenylobacterium soli]
MQPLDLLALAIFLVAWLFYEPFLTQLGRRGRLINTDMTVIRHAWMRNMVGRENRFMDGQLLGQALNSTSFFTSSNLILMAAIGGALFGGERTFRSASSLALVQTSSRVLFEAQLALVLACLARGLLDLIWTIRQLNYCIAAIGAVPVQVQDEEHHAYGDVVARLLNPALSSFNRGVRAYYFALAAAAWLFGAWAFMAATLGAVALLVWRQRVSPTARAVADLRRLLEKAEAERA